MEITTVNGLNAIDIMICTKFRFGRFPKYRMKISGSFHWVFRFSVTGPNYQMNMIMGKRNTPEFRQDCACYKWMILFVQTRVSFRFCLSKKKFQFIRYIFDLQITCGLSNRSIDCRLEYSSFIMPGPPFPLPPSWHDCCDRAECGGGESSILQWHWLSWHWALMKKRQKINKHKENPQSENFIWYLSMQTRDLIGKKLRCNDLTQKHWANSSNHLLFIRIEFRHSQFRSDENNLPSFWLSTLTRWTTTTATSARAIACWCGWFTLWNCVDWHYRTLCVTPWRSTPINCCCTPIAPRHHTFFVIIFFSCFLAE